MLYCSETNDVSGGHKPPRPPSRPPTRQALPTPLAVLLHILLYDILYILLLLTLYCSGYFIALFTAPPITHVTTHAFSFPSTFFPPTAIAFAPPPTGIQVTMPCISLPLMKTLDWVKTSSNH